ncbi:hypothetical protein CTI12_AA314620 [Artemisia annua]|uniref:Transposase, Ptta/En/Spm n=1 Tax=Artemisia annua TaxID=35608 RepID=A0A2U1N237_ARTAN|nr:hypothetical protein CTI12_AA314620 [Artemisia annua]
MPSRKDKSARKGKSARKDKGARTRSGNDNQQVEDVLHMESNHSDDDEVQVIQCKRVRGPTFMPKVWTVSDEERISVSFNEYGQPIDKKTTSTLTHFMGFLARSGKYCPLHKPWPKVGSAKKKILLDVLNDKFDLPMGCDDWILKSFGKKVRNWRARVKKDYYDPSLRYREQINSRPKRVHTIQWKKLVKNWNKENSKANRSKKKMVQVTGKKSYAIKREEVKDRMEELSSQLPKGATDEPGPQDVYSKVMGKDNNGIADLYGLGVRASDVWGVVPSHIARSRDKLMYKSRCDQLSCELAQLKARDSQRQGLSENASSSTNVVNEPQPLRVGPTLADLQMLIDEESEEDLVDFEDDAGLMAGDDMDIEDVTPTETPDHHHQVTRRLSPHHQTNMSWMTPGLSLKRSWLNLLEDANDDRHLEAAASYADFRSSMEEKQTELKTAFASTDDKVSGSKTSVEKLTVDQGSKFASILQTLTKIKQEFKDDPILSQDHLCAALSSLPALFKEVDFPALKSQQVSILSTLQAQEAKLTTLSSGYEQLTNKHNELVNCYTDKLAKLSETQQALSTDLSSLKTETSEIKGMVSDIFKLLQASPVQASPAPQAQAPAPQSTDASTKAPTSVEGEKITPTQRLFQQLDPHRHTKDDSQATTTSVPTPTTEIITEAVPIRSFMPGSSTVIITPVTTEATTTTTELPESAFSTPTQADRGKAIKVTEDSPPKLVKATREVLRDPDEPILFEEDDKLKAELLSRPDISEVAIEVIKETKQNIKGEHFLKLQAEMIKEANQKAKLNAERKQRNYERYVWTMTKTKGEGAITDMIIHSYKKNEPIGVTIERGPRVHERYAPFRPSDFGIKEWDMMLPILKKKKNKCVPDLLQTLTNKYKELEKVAKSLGINHQEAIESQGLAIPKQAQTIGRKRKAVGQEPEDFIAALHCNRAPPAGVKFVPNKVIKVPEYGLFFINELKEKAFQRVSDIHLVETTTLLTYKLMARNYRSPENEEFMMLMDKMMNERPDKHILLTKKAKLELMGIKEV